MEKAAVQLFNPETVSNPPDCRRRIPTAPMTAMAENLPPASDVRKTVGPRNRLRRGATRPAILTGRVLPARVRAWPPGAHSQCGGGNRTYHGVPPVLPVARKHSNRKGQAGDAGEPVVDPYRDPVTFFGWHAGHRG